MTNTTTTDPTSTSKTEHASNKASEVATAASDRAGSVATTAKEEAASVMHDAKHEARRLADESRDQLRQQADQQGQRLAQTLRDIGGQLQGMANGKAAPTGMVADVTQQAASSAHRMAQTLDQKGVQGVVDDVKRFARQRPGMFVLGALGAGVIAGRLIRVLDTGAIAQAAKPNTDSGNGQLQQPPQPPPAPADFGGPTAGTSSTLQGPTVVGPSRLNRPTEF